MGFYPEKLDTSEDTTGGREFRRSGGEAMDINVVKEKVQSCWGEDTNLDVASVYDLSDGSTKGEEVGCEPVTT